MSIFSLSLDDCCPHPKCTPFPGVIHLCNKLIKRWPDLKIDFFTSAAYARLNEDPYFLTQYPDWVKQMNDLPSKNFRVNCHSYYHRRLSAKHGNSNNNEMEKTSEKESRMLIEHMIGEFKTSGLKFERVFRPPGWHVGISAAKVLTEMGFVIAGNRKYFDLLKDKVPEMRYLITNWELREECILNGDVFAAGHTSNWCDNYFDKKTYDRVVKLLESRQFEFKFLSEL